jgi:hypothetical protein
VASLCGGVHPEIVHLEASVGRIIGLVSPEQPHVATGVLPPEGRGTCAQDVRGCSHPLSTIDPGCIEGVGTADPGWAFREILEMTGLKGFLAKSGWNPGIRLE